MSWQLSSWQCRLICAVCSAIALLTAYYFGDSTAAVALTLAAVVGHVVSMSMRTNDTTRAYEVAASTAAFFCGMAGLKWGKHRTKAVMALGVACASVHAVGLYALWMLPAEDVDAGMADSSSWLSDFNNTPPLFGEAGPTVEQVVV
jgi:hypothetical protein